MTYFIALALGYLFGSIPSGVILARVFGLGDLRSIGSGNIGATNVLRTGSKKAAALTLLFDALKGVVPVLLAAPWGVEAMAIAGLGAFLGHCFPVWLKFRGGKGVATFIGALLALYWPAFLGFAVTWLAVAFVTKYSSLAALVASVVALLVVVFSGVFGGVALLAVGAMVGLLIWRHSENIARLRAGTEGRISLGSKK